MSSIQPSSWMLNAYQAALHWRHATVGWEADPFFNKKTAEIASSTVSWFLPGNFFQPLAFFPTFFFEAILVGWKHLHSQKLTAKTPEKRTRFLSLAGLPAKTGGTRVPLGNQHHLSGQDHLLAKKYRIKYFLVKFSPSLFLNSKQCVSVFKFKDNWVLHSKTIRSFKNVTWFISNSLSVLSVGSFHFYRESTKTMQPNTSGNQSNNQLNPITFFVAPFLGCPKWDPSCLHPFKGTPKKRDTCLINTHYVRCIIGVDYSGTPLISRGPPHHFPYDPASIVVVFPHPFQPWTDRSPPVLGIQRDTLGIIQESTHRTLVMFLLGRLRWLWWCHMANLHGDPPNIFPHPTACRRAS